MKCVLAGMRDPTAFESVAGALAEVRPVRIDLSSREMIDACVDQAASDIAAVDLLVNNAGVMTGGLLEEQDTGEMYAMFQVNVVGPAHLIQKVLPGMLGRGRGKIVNNASIGAYAVFPGVSTYTATKTALVALTEALRRELRGTGIEVAHLVTPSVDTDMLDATEAIFSRHTDTSKWQRISAAEWAEQVVTSIEGTEPVVLPEGASAITRLVRREGAFPVDPLSDRTFSRDPR
jgi:short-subunit dehydrogenase